MSKQAAYHWDAHNLLAATQSLDGVWQGEFAGSSTRIITDTRKVGAGDVFLAIRGERFDAHDFVQAAVAAGAAAVIVERALACDVPQLIVRDTKLALGQLGKYRRDAHPDLTVIALTGSSGKTTTKEMLGAIFGAIAPTLVTRGNLNNDLGVPMMLLELTDAHRFAVLELGANHIGEIAYTASLVRPDVACVLNIGTAHLGEFGGRDNIARAKAEIFSALTADGVAVLPLSDDYFELLALEAAKFTTNAITFGEKTVPLADSGLSDEDQQALASEGVQSVLQMGDVFADDIETHSTHSDFELGVNLSADDLQTLQVRLPFIGEHNVTNAQAATAAALALGVSLKQIKAALECAVPPKGRLTRILFGEHILIDDTYNANPTSMIAAAKVLQGEAAQKVLVFGDIFELGEAASAEHRQLGEALAAFEIDAVLAVGDEMAHMVAALNAAKQAMPIATHFADKSALLEHLKGLLAKPSAVLFKGSRGMAMESLIDDLMANK